MGSLRLAKINACSKSHNLEETAWTGDSEGHREKKGSLPFILQYERMKGDWILLVCPFLRCYGYTMKREANMDLGITTASVPPPQIVELNEEYSK